MKYQAKALSFLYRLLFFCMVGMGAKYGILGVKFIIVSLFLNTLCRHPPIPHILNISPVLEW